MSDALAHLLRRATMAAHPERIAGLEGTSLRDAIDRIVDEAGVGEDGVTGVPWSGAGAPPDDQNDSWGAVAVWWVNRMSSPESGLQDRMAWLWHNWFTTNDEAYDGPVLSTATLSILYRYGLSDLRTLTQRIVTSGAMLRYLDAAGSQAYNPNENLARELMELYTVGPGTYTEHDVRAAARALAGWDVDDETGAVTFDDSAAFVAPLMFLGTQDEWDTAKVVDALVDHPSTATRVCAYLWYELVGTVAPEERLESLAKSFRDDGLRILPLVREILRSDEFEQGARTRYRSSIEWLTTTLAVIEPEPSRRDWLEPWHLEGLGQRPFAPPSPAGWPGGDYWTRPGSLLPRIQFVQDLDTDTVLNSRWTAESIVSTAGLPADDPVAPLLAAVLDDDRFERSERRRIAWRIALTCPTFQLN